MSGSGHPVGTVCVITWADKEYKTLSIGDTVTCVSAGEVVGNEARYVFIQKWQGRVVQHISYAGAPSHNPTPVYPSEWLRPIDKDTDARDDEVIEEYKHPFREFVQEHMERRRRDTTPDKTA